MPCLKHVEECSCFRAFAFAVAFDWNDPIPDIHIPGSFIHFIQVSAQILSLQRVLPWSFILKKQNHHSLFLISLHSTYDSLCGWVCVCVCVYSVSTLECNHEDNEFILFASRSQYLKQCYSSSPSSTSPYKSLSSLAFPLWVLVWLKYSFLKELIHW